MLLENSSSKVAAKIPGVLAFHISYSIFDIPYVIGGIERRAAMEYGIPNMEYEV
jgi:hypothetical protein